MLNHSVDSIMENKALFTDQQFQRAKQARQIYHALGTPSLHDFKAIIIKSVQKYANNTRRCENCRKN
jgi:hypothetical protein